MFFSKREKIVNLQRRLKKDIDNVEDSDDDASEHFKDLPNKSTEPTETTVSSDVLLGAVSSKQCLFSCILLFLVAKEMDVQT